MYNKLIDKLNIFSKEKIDLMHTTDLHSHLIPGIDDGVDTVEQSMTIIKQLQNLGFKKIITTPHIMQHRFPNSRNSILYRYGLLKKNLSKRA